MPSAMRILEKDGSSEINEKIIRESKNDGESAESETPFMSRSLP